MELHGMYKISDDCLECGTCAHVCPVQAIHNRPGKYWIDAASCTRCGRCLDVCPVSAPQLLETPADHFAPGLGGM